LTLVYKNYSTGQNQFANDFHEDGGLMICEPVRGNRQHRSNKNWKRSALRRVWFKVLFILCWKI